MLIIGLTNIWLIVSAIQKQPRKSLNLLKQNNGSNMHWIVYLLIFCFAYAFGFDAGRKHAHVEVVLSST